MTLTEVARILKQHPTTLNSWARQGKWKTARKEKLDRLPVWVLDDQEAEEYIKSCKENV